MVLEDGTEFVPLQFSSVDVQLLELRRLQVSEIARAFRIPPHMLADLERTTHHNAEEMGQQFLEGCLLAHIVNWEQAMRRALLTPEERQRYSIEFLVDGFARAALAPRYEAFSKATAGAAWMSANEARAKENLPPIEGGDVLMQPLNMTPADEERSPSHDRPPRLEVKFTAPTEAGMFEGLASLFGSSPTPSATWSPRAPSAARLTSTQRPAACRRCCGRTTPPRPIGTWTDIRETPEGLRVQGKLILETSAAREALRADARGRDLRASASASAPRPRAPQGRPAADRRRPGRDARSSPGRAPTPGFAHVKEAPMSVDLTPARRRGRAAAELPPEIATGSRTIETRTAPICRPRHPARQGRDPARPPERARVEVQEDREASS